MRIHTIDLLFANRRNTIASYLIEGNSGLALIEPGPGSTIDNCVHALAKLGVAPSDVQHVFVTHIHLDHGGGAGWWADQGANIYVHPKGARHLIDPTRLFESARMVYGDAMETLWGEMLPVPAEQLVVLEDGEKVELADFTIEAMDVQGHAKHHHAYLLDDVAFTGDAAGSRMPDDKYINLTSAPPQFDPHTFDAAITALEARQLSKLYVGHFGEVSDVPDHLARLREVVWGSAEFVHAQMRNGQPKETVIEKYVEFCKDRARLDGVDDASLLDYDTANGFAMSGEGIHLYWERLKR